MSSIDRWEMRSIMENVVPFPCLEGIKAQKVWEAHVQRYLEMGKKWRNVLKETRYCNTYYACFSEEQRQEQIQVVTQLSEEISRIPIANYRRRGV